MMKPRKRRSGRTKTMPRSKLTFSPTTWAKLLYLRDVGETEIGGFGISHPDDLLCVQDLALIPQITSPVSVEFDDHAVADYFEQQVALGYRPEQFARIWVHTHPGSCPLPSATDEATFARVFGRCDWAIMLILARGGATYARLAWNQGPRAALRIGVEVDFQRPFAGSDQACWQGEYDRCVEPCLRWHALGADWSDEILLALSH